MTIGAGCWIGPHAVINGPHRARARTTQRLPVRLHGRSPAGHEIQGRAHPAGDRRPQHLPRVRDHATAARSPASARPAIGNDNLLLAYSHVAHDCVLGDHIICLNVVQPRGARGSGRLGDHGRLLGRAPVLASIGAHAFIGNNTSVIRDIPPYVLARGHPAEPRSINIEGLKRRGFNEEQHPRHPQRLSRAVPQRPEARGCARRQLRRRWRADRAAWASFVRVHRAVPRAAWRANARRWCTAPHRPGRRRDLRRRARRCADRGAARARCPGSQFIGTGWRAHARRGLRGAGRHRKNSR